MYLKTPFKIDKTLKGEPNPERWNEAYLICMNATTGIEKWKTRLENEFFITGSPALDSGRVYIMYRIAASEDAMINELFQDTDKSTSDGYIQKRGKRFIDIWLLGQEYRLNKYGILCRKTKLDNGRYWYSFPDLKTMDNTEGLADRLCVEKEYKGAFKMIYRYK